MNRSCFMVRASGAWAAILLGLACGLHASQERDHPPGQSQTEAPWKKPRTLSAFADLLKHSPFSLPTAEESSPLAERYAITGVVTIGGKDQVFVFDRTDQSRELLTLTPNSKNMALVSIIRQGNSPLKASIRVGNETGTIGYLEASGQPDQNVAAQAAPGSPAAGTPPGGRPGQVRLPQLPPLPTQPGASQPMQGPVAPGRRIIRRPVITAPKASPTTP